MGIGAELVRTIRKIHQVEGRLARIDAEIAALNASELCSLKLRVDAERLHGRDLLAEMAGDLDNDIARLRMKVQALRFNEASLS